MIEFVFRFAITITLMIGIVVVIVAVGLVVQKMTYRKRASRRAQLEERYQQKIDPILLEDLPPDSLDPDSEQFAAAVRALCEPLRNELKATGPFARRYHRSALKNVMLRMSRDLVGETRGRLTLAFGHFGFIDDEIDVLRSARWWVRANACRNLSLMEAFEAGVPLQELLQDEEVDVKTEAAMAMIHIAGVRWLKPILENLTEISLWMSIQLSKAVIAMGSSAVPELVAALTFESRSVRKFCVETLGDIGDISACRALTAFARTADEDLLCASLISLGKLGDNTAQSFLLEHISDPREVVRIHAARGMGSLASPMTASLLKEHLMNDEIHVRLVAGRALTRIQETGRLTLIEAYQESDKIGRKIVMQFLEEIGVSDDELPATSSDAR